jgi:hypothetical protein
MPTAGRHTTLLAGVCLCSSCVMVSL